MNKLYETVQKVLKLRTAPKWMTDESISSLFLMGSQAYGVADEDSDVDLYGFCMPPLDIVFPHMAGEIPGFGMQLKRFENLQLQGVKPEESGYEKELDITIFSLARYAHLCLDGNPNMISSLYVPSNVHIKTDKIGEIILTNRSLFLSNRLYHKYRGMIYAHLSRLKNSYVKEGRKDLAYKYGFDTKDAYHSLRCAYELRQILTQHTIIMEEHASALKQVRNGEMNLDAVIGVVDLILKECEDLLHTSTLPDQPNEIAVKRMLVDCFEIYYGFDNFAKTGFRL